MPVGNMTGAQIDALYQTTTKGNKAMRDLETCNYHLAVGSGAGRGTFIIIRKRDDKTTLRHTGSEGEAAYKLFKRAYNISGETFDAQCATETFE